MWKSILYFIFLLLLVVLTLPDKKLFLASYNSNTDLDLPVYDYNNLVIRAPLHETKLLVAVNGDTFLTSAEVRLNEIRSVKNRLLHFPTALTWRAPLPGNKTACVVSAATVSGNEISNWLTIVKPQRTSPLPVMALQVNENDFFNPVNGIYTFGTLSQLSAIHYPWFNIPFNFTRRGNDWKVPCEFQFRSSTGKIFYAGNATVQINGNATRAFPQKSLRLSAVGPKKKKIFAATFFSDKHAETSLVLRNGGNDWGRSLISDAMQMDMLAFTGLEKPSYKACVVYINGEYWGIHQLCSRIDEKRLADKYGCKKKDVTLLEGIILSAGKAEEHQQFLQLIDSCKKNPAASFKKLNEKINVDNFLTYLAAMCFVANADWPRSNIKCFKIKNEPWQWILHDLDCAFGYAGNEWVQKDMFEFLENDPSYAGIFYRCCMTDEKTRAGFVNKLQHYSSTYFTPQRIKNIIRTHANEIKPEIPAHAGRWRKPSGVNQWEDFVSKLEYFAEHRNGFFQKQIKQHFHL